MAEHLVITTVDDDRWTGLIEAAPSVTPFHHPAWAQLLAECYGYPALVAGVVDDHGTMISGLPLIEVRHRVGRPRWVCLPYSDSCGPVAVQPDALGSLVTLLDVARSEAGIEQVQVRCSLPLPARPASSGAVMHRCLLPAAAADLHSTVNGSHRRGAVVASRRGVVLRAGERRKDLAEAFYALHVGTRRRHGVPVQPRRYFELLWDRVLALDLGLLLLAEVDGEPVAGGVFLAWRGTFIHKYSASDALAWPRHANDLLLWEALAWAVEHGCRQVDFGRSDLADTGLRDFKRAWGGREEPLAYSTIGKPAHDGRGRLAGMARPVFRHGPAWLTRVAGEVLYRYAA